MKHAHRLNKHSIFFGFGQSVISLLSFVWMYKCHINNSKVVTSFFAGYKICSEVKAALGQTFL